MNIYRLPILPIFIPTLLTNISVFRAGEPFIKHIYLTLYLASNWLYYNTTYLESKYNLFIRLVLLGIGN